MVLLLLLVGLIVAVWPTPVLRLAHRPAVSPPVLRAGGVTLAVLALLTALLIG